jgi:hypothetical protein
MSLRFVEDWEQRVERQKQLIAELRKTGRPTGPAEAVLKREEQSLATLRNHSEIMQELMTPDPVHKDQRRPS